MQKINTALLSFGMSGKLFHAPFIHWHPGFELCAVWERSKNLAAGIYQQVKTYRSLEQLLSDQNIELVVVNTPNATHYHYTRQALLAGKHVLVEKPFVVSTAEAEELIDLAKEQNRLLTVYQNRRYDSDFRTLKKILDEGVLGDVVEAEFHYDRFKLELSPKQHKEVPGPGTGALYDLGSHLIDQALQLFGTPEKVFADLRIVRDVSQVTDCFDLFLYYPNLRVRLHSSYLVKEPLPSYAIHGSNGSFIKSRTDVQETALQNGEKPGSENWGVEPEKEAGILNVVKDGADIRTIVPSLRGDYGDYFEGLYQAVRNQRPVPVSAEDGLLVIRVIEKAIQSSALGHVVSF